MASPLTLLVGSSFNQIVFANAKEWQRERKIKKGARIAKQRGLQFMQHQPPSAPGHGIPCPFFGRRASDARQVDLTGTVFHRWERTSTSHVNAGIGSAPIMSPSPPYISVFTGSMDTVKDILPSKLTDTQANDNNTGVHSVWPAACCQQRRPAGGLSKEGLFSTSWTRGWISERQTAGRRRLQPACPGRHMMVVDSIDVYGAPSRARYLVQALPSQHYWWKRT